jgi:hypothetical protein
MPTKISNALFLGQSSAIAAVQSYQFVVNEKPYCVWSADLESESLAFLAGIDPFYFLHLADIHAAALEGPERKYASVALRVAYSQALETFLALLASLIQAPLCPLGWMLKYRTEDLTAVLRKLQSGEQLYAQGNSFPTWELLAGTCCPSLAGDDGVTARPEHAGYPARFARLWQTFAAEFLERDFSDEYNSIKHGLRAGIGGFQISIGVNPIADVPPPPPLPAQGSEFGSSFYSQRPIVPVGGERTPKVDFQLAFTARNWDPYNLARRIHLVTLSIRNVVSTLQVWGGLPRSSVQFGVPASVEDFDISEIQTMTWAQFRRESNLSVAAIPLTSPASVLAAMPRWGTPPIVAHTAPPST